MRALGLRSLAAAVYWRLDCNSSGASRVFVQVLFIAVAGSVWLVCVSACARAPLYEELSGTPFHVLAPPGMN